METGVIKRIVVLNILIVTASSTDPLENLPNCQIQTNNTEDTPLSPFICGGNFAGRHEFPWIVNLRLSSQNFPYCSGSLIDWDWVVTAAHCLFYPNTLKPVEKDRIILTAGDFNTSCNDNWKQWGYPESIIIHPMYQSNPILHDIALVKLKQKFHKTEAVQPIELPSYNILENTQEGTVIGWGRTESKLYSEILLKANISLNKSLNCTLYDKESQFCGGGVGIDSCDGDSGGPLMCLDKNFVLCGLVSFGLQDCGVTPGTYTNVYFYLEFILENRGFKPSANSLMTWWQYSIIISLIILVCLLLIYMGYKNGRQRQLVEPLLVDN